MKRTFFTADPHLGHRLVAEDRGYTTSDAHDQAFADAWRTVVRPRDTVWVLGDVTVGNFARKAAPLLSKLPGTKRLVAGNHDQVHHLNRGWLAKLQAYQDVFASVHTEAAIRVDGHLVKLSHFPFQGDHVRSDGESEDRYTEFRPQDTGGWLIHGHVHDAWKVNGRQINVGFDVWDGPVPQTELESIITLAERRRGQNDG